MSAPTVLDLFSGAAGGWSLGLHRAGLRTVAACENDPWRAEMFRRNNPGAIMYPDVGTLTAERIKNDLGYLPDAIFGSPPCQDASAANVNGKGLDGARTGLFFEAVRLVDEIRPRWCGFENVPAIRTRGVDRLLAAMEAIGYAVQSFVVGADDVGANHRRKRVWFIAFDPAQVGRVGGGPWRHWAHGDGASHAARCDVSDADREREPHGAVDAKVGGGESAGGDAPEPWADWNGGPASHIRLDARVSAGLADRRGLAGQIVAAFGDAVVPAIPELIGRAIRRVELEFGEP